MSAFETETVATPSSRMWYRRWRAMAAYLLGDAHQLHGAAAVTPAVHLIVPIGLLIGIIWMVTFRMAWWRFGDPELNRLRFLPALAVIGLECFVTGRGLIRSFAHNALAQRTNESVEAPLNVTSALRLIFGMLLFLGVLVSLPERIGWYPASDDWRSWLDPLYPIATYRPLILAPLWGRWTIMMAATIGRAAPEADDSTKRIVDRLTPMAPLFWLMLPMTLSVMYTLREGRLLGGILSGMAVMCAAYYCGLSAARNGRGNTRRSILAAGFVGQLTFLVFYRALCV